MNVSPPLIVAALLVTIAFACKEGNEGTRCDATGPASQCASGLTCTVLAACGGGMAVCCPTSGPTTDPLCGDSPPCAEPSDGGGDDGSADAPSDAPGEASHG